ncbi:MAG: protein kinase domain-containing protein [Gemmatimonadota bacterium]
MEGASKSNLWSEADALFTAALEMDAAARDAFLARKCGERPELRREVEELLYAAAASEACFADVPVAIGSTLDECISARVGTPMGGKEPEEEEEAAGRLIGRYRVVRRLARGGMGTVYLAERADGAFRRRVALKLLRRGLDTDDILDRFRAERQILADLEHPNIARLIDGGSTADGRPYLVMEYVDGVPITDYCDEHELDLEARLRLFVEVCDAVDHAHAHGVIHRDLKPGNILVDRTGHAKLLDFGIARLLSPDADAPRTRPGLRLLTPDYASPEQVRAGDIDAASDVYQLGLLLYELLTGSLPYHVKNRSVTELERVVCREPVAPPSAKAAGALRRRLRGDLDSIALQALRKDAADRYESAAALSQDIRRCLENRPVAARSGARGYRLRFLARRHRRKLGLAAGAAFALLAATLLTGRGSSSAPTPVPGSVAVLPFRVSGADASLGYLREGMVDLLSTKLTGEGGPRAIAPATVLGEWRDAGGSETRDVAESRALALAGRIGAEQLLVGEVVGTPDHVILSASLLETPDGRVAARATVEGSADSLLAVIDALTARLLALGAGESPRPLDAVATTSLPALRAYLDGRVSMREARYADAYELFSEAVELDSTFALAAVRAWWAAWSTQGSADSRLLQIAREGRDRLGESDLAFVEAVFGPNYPAPYSDAERLAMRRRLVDIDPDRVEFRFIYADRLYHYHAMLGLPDGQERAAAQFRRALAADSTYAPTYEHLVPLLYSLGYSDEATEVARAYLQREPAGGAASFLAWRMAAAQGNEDLLAIVRARFEDLPDEELLQIFSVAVEDGVEVSDADRAIDVLRRRGVTPAVRRRVLREDFVLQLARGRPAAAAEVAEKLQEAQRDEAEFPPLETTNSLVLSALYGDGDPGAAARALETLAAAAFGPGDSPRPNGRVPDLCTVSQWRLWNGDHRGVSAAVERLRTTDTLDRFKDTGPVCAMLLEAIESTLLGRPDADDRLARLDSALTTGPQTLFTTFKMPANLAAARLYERRGDYARALAAVRRRVYDMDSTGFVLATSLRIEGRLAAAAGDTAGAIDAYRHYLALRSDPEPALRAQADSVRVELAELTAASS